MRLPLIIKMTELDELFDGAHSDVPLPDMSCYFGNPEDYTRTLFLRVQEDKERFMGRILTCAAYPKQGLPGGTIGEWGGRLHFQIGDKKVSIVGGVTKYDPELSFVIATLRDPEQPSRFVGGCILFPDCSAAVPKYD